MAALTSMRSSLTYPGCLRQGSRLQAGTGWQYLRLSDRGLFQEVQARCRSAARAQVAVPNDPTNLGLLLLLQKQGLIKLKDNVGLNGTVLDIVDNPKQLKIVELESAQLPRSLDDVDLAIINTTYASQIDLLPTRDGLFVEDKDSPYVNLIVAREDNKDAEKVKQFVAAYQKAMRSIKQLISCSKAVSCKRLKQCIRRPC